MVECFPSWRFCHQIYVAMLVLAQLVAAGVAKSPGDHIICKHGTSAGDNFRWHMVGDVTGKQLATMALSPAPQWRRHRRIVGDKGCVTSTSMATSPANSRRQRLCRQHLNGDVTGTWLAQYRIYWSPHPRQRQ